MKRSFTVLVVEKSDVVRRLTKRLLKKEGLHVLEAPDAPTALAVLFQPEHHVDLVVIGEIGSPEREQPPWKDSSILNPIANL